jgi:membrane-associated phospholipid phosphatase
MSAVFVAAGRQIPAARGLACGFAGLAAATAVLPRVADRWAVAGMRMLLQGVALLSIYESLGLVIDAIGPQPLDSWILACERLVTRGHLPPLAVVMLPAWASDLLSMAYVTYFVLPVSLIVALIRRQGWIDAHAATLTLLVAFYLHYAIYVLVPVVGPVRTTALPADIRMHIVAQGSWLAHHLRTLIGVLERTTQDGFPSAHTSITLLIAAIARKHRLRWRWAFYVVAVPIIVSTVLLGYHYVVDVLAALPVAWAAWRLSQTSELRWESVQHMVCVSDLTELSLEEQETRQRRFVRAQHVVVTDGDNHEGVLLR